MIISRTPLRLTLSGGGTDAPEFLEQEDGFAVTTTIDEYIYVAINPTFDKKYRIKYSHSELTDNIDDIQHNIIREALRLYDIGPGVEIVSFADIPSGTGLGSSGAFTVGILGALSAFTNETVSQGQLAARAAELELNVLGSVGGRQDHYACACGGILGLTFRKDPFYVYPLRLSISRETKDLLERRLLLFYTGYRRDAESVLSNQSTKGLSEIKQIALQAKNLLQDGDMYGFGQTLNAHWELKKLRSNSISNTTIDYWYSIAMNNGALGGKLIGAGGGGFLMLYTEDPEWLTVTMEKEGLPRTRFKLDDVGTTIIAND